MKTQDLITMFSNESSNHTTPQTTMRFDTNSTFQINSTFRLNATNNSTIHNDDSVMGFQATAGNIIEIVVLFIVCVMILLGNSLVVLAYIKGPRSIRTHTNKFVVNLAVGDLMVGCLSVPFWICVKLSVVDPELSPYFISLDILFGATSIFSLVAISLERMAAVHYPTFHYNMSNKPVICSILATWFIGLLLFGFRIYIKHEQLFEFTITIFIVSFILPLIIILFSYTVLFMTAHKLQKADNVSRSHSVKRDLHIAKTISIIIGLLFICWAPFFILNLMYVVCETCLNGKEFVMWVSISKIMHYGNSMMNFFVYAVRSPEFRKTFDALVFNGCKTAHLRERLRTFSETSRKRGASLLLLRKTNQEQHKDSPKVERLREKKSATLAVPATSGQNGQNGHSYSSETYLTDCSDSATLYPYRLS